MLSYKIDSPLYIDFVYLALPTPSSPTLLLPPPYPSVRDITGDEGVSTGIRAVA